MYPGATSTGPGEASAGLLSLPPGPPERLSLPPSGRRAWSSAALSVCEERGSVRGSVRRGALGGVGGGVCEGGDRWRTRPSVSAGGGTSPLYLCPLPPSRPGSGPAGAAEAAADRAHGEGGGGGWKGGVRPLPPPRGRRRGELACPEAPFRGGSPSPALPSPPSAAAGGWSRPEGTAARGGGPWGGGEGGAEGWGKGAAPLCWARGPLTGLGWRLRWLLGRWEPIEIPAALPGPPPLCPRRCPLGCALRAAFPRPALGCSCQLSLLLAAPCGLGSPFPPSQILAAAASSWAGPGYGSSGRCGPVWPNSVLVCVV